MNQLQSRKQLLLSESELNRVLMSEDMAAVRAEIRVLTARAKSFSSIASSAAVLMAGLAAFQRGKSAETAAKHSWWQTLIKATSLFSTIWLTLRARRRNRDEN